MKETDFKNAKVGDTVYKLTLNGFIGGRIINIDDRSFPIIVEFREDIGGVSRERYNMGGQHIDDSIQLFWNKFNIPERPKRKVQKTIDYWLVINTGNNSLTSFLEKRLAEDFMYEKIERTTNVYINYIIVPQTVTYEVEE